jgi:phage regulator Rha-like protein
MSYYEDSYSRHQPMYLMNRDGFTLLAMGFTGKKALKFKLEYINAFNQMERQLKEASSPQLPQTFSEALMLAARQAEQLELQAKELKIVAPKVQYHDEVLQSINTYTSTQVAKEVGLKTAEQLHKELKKRGVMFHQSGQWLLTANYCGQGYTKPRTHTYTSATTGLTSTNTITVWTETGRKFIHETLTV